MNGHCHLLIGQVKSINVIFESYFPFPVPFSPSANAVSFTFKRYAELSMFRSSSIITLRLPLLLHSLVLHGNYNYSLKSRSDPITTQLKILQRPPSGSVSSKPKFLHRLPGPDTAWIPITPLVSTLIASLCLSAPRLFQPCSLLRAFSSAFFFLLPGSVLPEIFAQMILLVTSLSRCQLLSPWPT